MIRDLIGTNLLIDQDEKQAFNLDTILLSNFVKVRVGTKSILDYGCGNGSISLYLSRKTDAKIIGIEIQESLAEIAKKNVELNFLEGQVKIINDNIINAPNHFKNIDIVVSNPPFFKVKPNTKINELDYKALARHEIDMTLEELIESASKVLKTRGKLFLIHRPERLFEIEEICSKNRLAIKRIRFVHPYQEREANHVLIEAHKDGKKEVIVEAPLILYQEKHKFSEELKLIYQDNNYQGGH